MQKCGLFFPWSTAQKNRRCPREEGDRGFFFSLLSQERSIGHRDHLPEEEFIFFVGRSDGVCLDFAGRADGAVSRALSFCLSFSFALAVCAVRRGLRIFVFGRASASLTFGAVFLTSAQDHSMSV